MDINRTTTPKETIYAPFKPDEEAPYIFISYSHRDRDRVFPIITRLYEKGWRVWYDEGLEVTENYYTSLSRHIKNCTVFLLFLTENSVKSEFVSEHELLLATTIRKRIAVCRLDENAEFEGEAKDAIDIATVSKKNPKTDEAGLEAALESIEELPRFAPRKAEGFKVQAHQVEILLSDEADEYEFEKCEGGIRLTKYKGNESHVILPQTYKGQQVTELAMNFRGNNTLKSLQVPATVRRIRHLRFDWCDSLTDIFIPASVKQIDEAWDSDARNWGSLLNFTVHCAEDTAAFDHARKYPGTIRIKVDPSLNWEEKIKPVVTAGKHYAFCSYAGDQCTDAEHVIHQLTANGCTVEPSFSLSRREKSKSYRDAACMIVFLSQGYIDSDEIDYLYRAIEGNKPFLIYALDSCMLPDDIDIAKIHDQQLRFDNGTEADRIAKLIEWLSKIGCVTGSGDIPDFDYSTDIDGGIILTKYIGKEKEVVVSNSYGGHSVVALKGTFFNCKDITSIKISGGVKTIGKYTFGNCSSLVSLIIPDSVFEIGEYAFFGCSNLVSLSFPDSVLRIEHDACYQCETLRSVTIEGKRTRIDGAFWNYGETVLCHKDSEAWRYCEENNIPHKPIGSADIPDKEIL